MRIIDPWGNKVDLSARGFLGREEKKLPGVRYVVVQTETPERAAEFYKSVFDLEEIGKSSDGALRLSDGDITLELTKKQSIDKPGIQYFGVQVEDWSQAKSRCKELGLELPDSKDSEVQLTDPEGNLFTVSQRGWERVTSSSNR
jgi:predicted enzyme related to lactoylglutathione lyase